MTFTLPFLVFDMYSESRREKWFAPAKTAVKNRPVAVIYHVFEMITIATFSFVRSRSAVHTQTAPQTDSVASVHFVHAVRP
jgi:hypothetical protein